MSRRITGTVVGWKGGFGFVQENTAAKTEYYVHYSSLQVEENGFRALTEGQQVEFEVGQHDGKIRAVNVTSVGGAPLPSGQDGRRGGNAFGGGGRGRGGQFAYGGGSVAAAWAGPTGQRVSGTVTHWNDDRNFGFIQDHTAENREHYVHFSALVVQDNGFRALTKGQEVEFDVEQHYEKTRAVNVTSVGGVPLPPGQRRQGAGGYGGGRGFGGGRGGYEQRPRY